MLEIYVFRHGETEWNEQRRLQGHSDISLNSTGKAQAQALFQSQTLPISECDCVYVSDLKRSQETAQIATGGLLPLKVDARLREVFLGDFEGRTHAEILAEYGTEYWDRWYDFSFENWDMKVPKGESKNEMLQRSLSFLEDIKKTGAKKVLICGHGFWIRTLDSYLKKEPQQQTLKNCELLIWTIT